MHSPSAYNPGLNPGIASGIIPKHQYSFQMATCTVSFGVNREHALERPGLALSDLLSSSHLTVELQNHWQRPQQSARKLV